MKISKEFKEKLKAFSKTDAVDAVIKVIEEDGNDKLQELELLQKQYSRRVETLKVEMAGLDQHKDTYKRLRTKEGCFRAFQAEIEKILNY